VIINPVFPGGYGGYPTLPSLQFITKILYQFVFRPAPPNPMPVVISSLRPPTTHPQCRVPNIDRSYRPNQGDLEKLSKNYLIMLK
jgi:hypothetical protein